MKYSCSIRAFSVTAYPGVQGCLLPQLWESLPGIACPSIGAHKKPKQKDKQPPTLTNNLELPVNPTCPWTVGGVPGDNPCTHRERSWVLHVSFMLINRINQIFVKVILTSTAIIKLLNMHVKSAIVLLIRSLRFLLDLCFLTA